MISAYEDKKLAWVRETIIADVGQKRFDSWCQKIAARPLPVLSVTKDGKRRRNGNRKQIGLEPRKRRQHTETVFAFIKENPECRKREIMGAHPRITDHYLSTALSHLR